MTVLIGIARRALLSAAAAACVAATDVKPAAAQQGAAQQVGPAAEPDAAALEEIDVVGERWISGRGWLGASDAVYDTPGSVAEIGREAIDQRGGARNAADLFRGTAGVDGVLDRQNPGLNVNIRGLQDQGRVNMSIDGARQNFQQSGHGASAFAYVDPELIGGVEIDKGPTSLAGGAGVIGGVVNFRTLDFEDVALGDKDHGVRLNATTGTNAFDFNGSLAAAAKVSDAFDVVAAVGRRKLGEYKAGKRGELTYGGPGEPAEYTTQDQWSWLVKATARPNDANTVKLTYTGLDARFDTGSGTYIDSNDVQNHTVVGDWRFQPGGDAVDLAAKLYYTRTANEQVRPERRTASGAVALSEARVDYAIDTYGGSLANTSRFSVLGFDVALTYGGEYFLDKTDTASVYADASDDPSNSQFSGSNPVGDRGVGGVFARAELKHSTWLTLLGGLRYDRYHLSGSGVVFDGQTTGCGVAVCPSPFDVDKSGGRVSPTATVAVTPFGPGLQVYGSYEQGFRPPNLMEAVLGGEHVGGALSTPFAPNPNLRPEVSRTLEAGVNVKLDGVMAEGDAFRAKASVYSTRVRDFITQAVVATPGSIPYVLSNVNLDGDTRLKGVDLEANYDAGFAYAGVTASFIEADYPRGYEGRPNFGDQETLAGVYLSPKRKIALDGGARFLERKLTIGGRATHVVPENTISPLSTYAYVKYTLLDVYASYRLNDNLTFRASIENLRDVAYVEAMGAALSPSPGRTFTVGATARF